MSTVYVVHHEPRRGHDISDVNRYGKPTVVFSREFFPDEAHDMAKPIVQQAAEALKDFDEDEDFLCIIGSPVYAGVCTGVLIAQGCSAIRMLRYDRLEHAYYEVRFPIGEVVDEMDGFGR